MSFPFYGWRCVFLRPIASFFSSSKIGSFFPLCDPPILVLQTCPVQVERFVFFCLKPFPGLSGMTLMTLEASSNRLLFFYFFIPFGFFLELRSSPV